LKCKDEGLPELKEKEATNDDKREACQQEHYKEPTAIHEKCISALRETLEHHANVIQNAHDSPPSDATKVHQYQNSTIKSLILNFHLYHHSVDNTSSSRLTYHYLKVYKLSEHYKVISNKTTPELKS